MAKTKAAASKSTIPAQKIAELHKKFRDSKGTWKAFIDECKKHGGTEQGVKLVLTKWRATIDFDLLANEPVAGKKEKNGLEDIASLLGGTVNAEKVKQQKEAQDAKINKLATALIAFIKQNPKATREDIAKAAVLNDVARLNSRLNRMSELGHEIKLPESASA